MQLNPGTNPFTPLSTPAGKGIFPTPDQITSDTLSASNLTAAEGALVDRTNWISHRVIDWQHAGTATYTPRGTVKFLANSSHGWDFRCYVTLGGTTTVPSGGVLQFLSGAGLATSAGAGATLYGDLTCHGDLTADGTTTVKQPIQLTGSDPTKTANPGAKVVTSLGICKAHGKINMPAGVDATLTDGLNISNVASHGLTYLEITFAGDFANADYTVEITRGIGLVGDPGGGPVPVWPVVATTGTAGRLDVAFEAADGSLVLADDVAGKLHVTVHGRQ